MIKTFGDKETEIIWTGVQSKKLPNEIQKVARRKRRIMERLNNIHPGEVLREEFLEPLGISAYRLAKDTFLPQTRISEIIKGNRRITADTALRFAKFFGTSAKFWLGLQDDYDLEEGRIEKEKELSNIRTLEGNAV